MMKKVSLITLSIFAFSLLAGFGVHAGDDDKKHEMFRRHHDKSKYKCMKYRKKYKHYKHKYYKYKKKYYHAKKRDHDRMKKFWKGVKELNLSEGQKSRLHDLKYDWKLEKVDLKSSVEKEKIRLHRLKDEETVDRNRLNELLDNLYRAKAEYKKAKYGFKLDVKDLLDTDQRKKLQETMKQHHHKDHGKHDKHSRKDHEAKKDRDHDEDEEAYFFSSD